MVGLAVPQGGREDRSVPAPGRGRGPPASPPPPPLGQDAQWPCKDSQLQPGVEEGSERWAPERTEGTVSASAQNQPLAPCASSSDGRGSRPEGRLGCRCAPAATRSPGAHGPRDAPAETGRNGRRRRREERSEELHRPRPPFFPPSPPPTAGSRLGHVKSPPSFRRPWGWGREGSPQ